MESRSVLQCFASDKEGRIRSVDEVQRGLACECVCPCCGEPVIARQGQVREWHFAHASGTDCEGAAEGALHLAAKQLLLESGGMTVPEVSLRATERLPDGRTGAAEVRRPESWLDFDSAEAEKAFGTIRPDVTVTTGGAMLFVEIAVTHFIDDAKRKAIAGLSIPTVEIDLAGVPTDRWDWDTLREVVVDGSTRKEWIHPLDRGALEREARAAALLAAWASAPPVTHESPAKPARTRFRVNGRIVDVVERPFGLTLWCPYDPELNERIKALVRYLGGSWQPKFKNWLFPLAAKAYLLDELGKWSGRLPEQVT